MALVGAAEWGLAARRGSRRGSAGGRVRHKQGSRLGSRGWAEDVGGTGCVGRGCEVAEDGQRVVRMEEEVGRGLVALAANPPALR